jgi:hypothetical protein
MCTSPQNKQATCAFHNPICAEHGYFPSCNASEQTAALILDQLIQLGKTYRN